MKWYVIYTKPRQEDNVEESLARASVEVFNPKLRRKRLIRGKYRHVIRPLFPNYLFAKFDPSLQYNMVKYTRGVSSIVGNRGLPWPVSEDIIDIIKSRLNEEGLIVITPDIKVGDKVEITEGPFRGFIGIFEREMKDSERIIVLLNTVEYRASLDIEKELLRKK
ncbi:MAG TPA: transcription termination/antitermination NusG family protein [Dissulfurispiraceae bacterium]|nr:transcription termination/antitermination NusG family protein [Dissulfurispiraceae bacterium]